MIYDQLVKSKFPSKYNVSLILKNLQEKHLLSFKSQHVGVSLNLKSCVR